MGEPPSQEAKPNQSELRQNPQLADRTTKPQLSIQTISNARTTVTSMFNEHCSTCQFQAKQGKNQDMHKYTWLRNTTPNQQDLQNGIKKTPFWTDQWVRCAVCVCSTNAQHTKFVRILIILDGLRQNAIDLWQNSAHLKAEATCLLKNWWQNISRSPTK